MDPLAAFDARRAIAKWMSLKQRRLRTDDSQQKVQKYMSVEYVKNVFSPSSMPYSVITAKVLYNFHCSYWH